MLAQCARTGGECGVVRNQRSALPVSAKVFTRIKTEARYCAKSADDFATILRAVRLAGVLDQRQIMFLGDLKQRLEVCRVTVEMNRKNRFGSWRDRLLDQVRVQIERGIVHIHIYRLCADV